MSRTTRREIILQKINASIDREIIKLEEKITKIWERWPSDMYGCRGDEKAEPLNEEIKDLRKLKDELKNIEWLRMDLKNEKQKTRQRELAFYEAITKIAETDPHEAEKIRRRWRL